MFECIYVYAKLTKPQANTVSLSSSFLFISIYVGEGYVIHLAPPSEDAQAGANRMMSVLHEKATVKKEELYEVVGNNDYHVSHLTDEKYKLTWNCEHFSHWCECGNGSWSYCSSWHWSSCCCCSHFWF
uniref:LRAT domain-containing protein n=1 Tax=Sinocyclocheilus anshuiensis TaxID=1608454 RepID=A0A671KQZ0_9TELE